MRAQMDFRLAAGVAPSKGTVDDLILRLVWLCRAWGEGEPPPEFAPSVEVAFPGVAETARGHAPPSMAIQWEGRAPSFDDSADAASAYALELWRGIRTTRLTAPTADGAAMIINEVCSGRPAGMLAYLIDRGAVAEVRSDIAWAVLELSYTIECGQPAPRVVLDAAEAILQRRCATGFGVIDDLGIPDLPRPSPAEPGAPPSAASRRPGPLPHPPVAAGGGRKRSGLRAAAAGGALAAAFTAILLVCRPFSTPDPAGWGQAKAAGELTDRAHAISAMNLAADGRTLVIGGDDATIELWDLLRRARTRRLIGPTGNLTSVALSPSGDWVAGSSLGRVWLWDTSTGRETGRLLAGRTSWVYSVAFSPDGSTLAAGTQDDYVRLWDVRTGREIGRPLTGHRSAVYSVAFSPDGRTLASGGADDSVLLWDLRRGTSVRRLMGDGGAVRSVAFSPDGSTLAAGTQDDYVRLWDVRTGRASGRPLTGHRSAVYSVAFSPDGRTLASGGADDSVLLWDLRRGTSVRRLTRDGGAVRSVAFSPDGSTLAVAGRSVELWRRR
ncbi:WD40 repeat domain-containing protein [Nonomuraea sp. NPDC049158]|uniref:WD40 repeat domain-containing protein n=1 Tax=Nonomuraea sp. NPDC049158 TaxID=3155649 RepID=UPI0033F16743